MDKITTSPLRTFILAVQNTQEDLLTRMWARERLLLVISVFAVILGLVHQIELDFDFDRVWRHVWGALEHAPVSPST